MLNELSSRFLKVLKYLIEEHEVTDNKDFASKISVSTSMITEISWIICNTKYCITVSRKFRLASHWSWFHAPR